MSRPLRIEYPGAYYHVMNRGRDRLEVYDGPESFQLFIELLAEAHDRFKIELHAYCLMNNHYHLFVQTPEPNLGRAMRHIDGVYTQRYNKLRGGDGSVFRGRYKAILVDSNTYFLQVSRYIHLNPITANIVKIPEDYCWSSYKYFGTKQEKPSWINCEETFSQLASNDPIQAYRDFVTEGLDNKFKLIFETNKLIPILGTKKFIEDTKLRFISELSDKQKDIPQKKMVVNNSAPEVERIISVVSRYFKVNLLSKAKDKDSKFVRGVAIYLAVQLSTMNQTNIAGKFEDLSASSVSRAYQRIDIKLKDNDGLAQIIETLKNQILSQQDLTSAYPEKSIS